MNRLLIVLALLAAAPAVASTPSGPATSPAEPRQLADQAMKFVARDDMKGLFTFVEKHMPIDKKELGKIRDTTITQRKTLPAGLGAYLGYAFVNECRRGEFLTRLNYVEKREKNVIRWQFVLYKPRDTWQISAFYWDNKTEELFAPCN